MARAAGSRGVDANVPECSRFTACECPSTDREHQRSRAGRAGQAAKVPVPARLENAQARRPRAASTHPARDLPRQNQRRKSRQPHITQDLKMWEQDLKM